VLFSLIGFALVYTALIVVDIHLLTKFAKAGPELADTESVSVE
jgi:cytochrome bd-type quinol oxidase subunit 1